MLPGLRKPGYELSDAFSFSLHFDQHRSTLLLPPDKLSTHFFMKKIFLKPKKEEALRRKHPWIFSGAIRHLEAGLTDGDRVEVLSRDGEVLAAGHYHDGSIAVRVLSFGPSPLDAAFWQRRIATAVAYRRQIGLPNDQTTCYRLIHGEGDQLPGLIVDVYGATAVLQCHSIGMHRERQVLAAAIQSALPGIRAIYDKSTDVLPARYAAKVEGSYLVGQPQSGEVLENGFRFFVDWESGQKTGFFLDQRDNRQLLTHYVKGKKVLNAFSYSGGFSVYALGAGASEVCSVDISKKAIAWTEKNVGLNVTETHRHKAVCGNVSDFLKNSDCYEVMVVDPPAFAKNIRKRHNAVQGYKRLNTLAMRKLSPGGILFTFSCSQVIDRSLFYNTMVAAALEAGRQVRVMHHLSQSADHPVNLFHPEGAYLKGIVLCVE